MKTLDPRVKLLCILLCTSLALVFKNVWYMAGVCAFTLLSARLLGGDMGAFLRKLRHVVKLLIGLALIQILFVRSGAPLITVGSTVLVTVDGLNQGVMTALRYSIILCSAAIMAGENSRRVIQSLVQAGMPYLFAFMLQIALRFLPTFAQSYTDSLTAIQLRGVEIKQVPLKKRIGLYGHLLLPVVADAIQKSQEMAMTMEARGFGAQKRRTSYLMLTLRGQDITAMAVLFGLFIGALCAYYLL